MAGTRDFVRTAELLMEQKEYARATRYLERCLRLSPQDPKTLKLLSRAFRKLERFDESIAFARQGLKVVDFRPWAFERYLALAYQASGKPGLTSRSPTTPAAATKTFYGSRSGKTPAGKPRTVTWIPRGDSISDPCRPVISRSSLL